MQYNDDIVDIKEITSITKSLDAGLGNDGQSPDALNIQFKSFNNKLSYPVRPVSIQGESTKMKALRARLPVSDDDLPKMIAQSSFDPQEIATIRSQWIDNVATSNQLRADNWKPTATPFTRPVFERDEFELLDKTLFEDSKSDFSRGM